MTAPSRRWLRLALGLAVVLALLAVAAFQFAVHLLKGRVEQALGPRGEVAEIRVGWSSVELRGLRLPAPPAAGKAAWPADDLLRAERVVVTPSLRDLFSARIVVHAIRIEGAYLSMLRTPEQKLEVLPGVTGKADAEDAKTTGKNAGKDAKNELEKGPAIHIGRIELVDGTVEYFDASIRRPPLKLRLEQIKLRLDDLQLPDLLDESRIEVSGVIKGPQHDGKLEIGGTMTLGNKESDLTTRLRGVDLMALRPYLIRAADTGISRGTLDLDLHSTVHHGRLHAPGSLTLHQLELAGGGSFLGLPQAAMVGLMKDRQGRIDIGFTLEGDLNDPRFSLNEQMLGRIGAALANALGVSLESLGKGAGGAGGSIVRGIGEALGTLLGK